MKFKEADYAIASNNCFIDLCQELNTKKFKILKESKKHEINVKVQDGKMIVATITQEVRLNPEMLIKLNYLK